ncbi:hypothetical protein J7E97_17635 [Streptomyces sp. ISL-66]|uniref:hypothetical protein n=1 Tax=Streptomyces sp. ISL-66 TaxID=2819186 RepID=UPI001BE5C265|nr:hypothetical protein [Streptomyces sp. ISL-66]MBT2469647.1 hypothetical protein [Streptomyces sp. ISL-66]
MRTKLAGIVGIITLGLAVVLGISGDLESNSADQQSVQAEEVGPRTPSPAPAPGL